MEYKSFSKSMNTSYEASAVINEKPVELEIDKRPFAEPAPQDINLSILQENLRNCLNIIDDEVMKGYVTRLDQLPIIIQDDKIFDNLNEIHFFKISELVYHEDEFTVDKLSMVFHALSNKPCTLVLMLRSDGEKTEFYLGARPRDERSSGTLHQMLKQGLLGFFPGTQISNYYDEDLKRDIQNLKAGCISSVTSVADFKQDKEERTNKDFIQGLEKFVYAMQGKAYTAICIADNLSYDELMMTKREYEQIYNQLSPFANIQMNFSVNDSTSTSKGSSEGTTQTTSRTTSKGTAQTFTDSSTHTVGNTESTGLTETHTENSSDSKGETHTTGTTEGTSHTITKTKSSSTSRTTSINSGASLFFIHGGGSSSKTTTSSNSNSVSKGTSHTDSISDSISKTLTRGFSDSKGVTKTSGISESKSQGESFSSTVNDSDAFTAGEAFNLVNTKTITDTFGTSRSVTLNAQNMTLNLAMQRLQTHLKRIEECESFGMWNFSAYFIGESAAETETAANTYKAVTAGTNSGIERNAINTWSEKESVEVLMPYLSHFVHPQFLYTGFSYGDERHISVNPSALISTNELSIHMGLPRHSVRGLPVVEHAAFGQEVISRKIISEKAINLGKIYHMGQETETDVRLDQNSFAMHTFVTGSTGSGKSNAVYQILGELKKNGIPFLVIEPAKGEYKRVFKEVKCYGTNPLVGEMLRINPFSFPEGVHVLEHIDRIVEIFNVCWPMYAAMPAVLKESIENAYKSAGWDLDLSINEKVDQLYPTFDDVLRELDKTINSSDYSADTKGDYIGSLSTRIKSLTNGINGRVFVSNEMLLEDLFDKSAIIDISRVGAMETKALIMGIVVMKLQEYRMAYSSEMNSDLKHVTVLEEAHNLLKKTSSEQSTDSSNLVGKSVEMLTNAIAEIRTYGEGFVIVDQAPNLLDTAAIRNTNTKIVLRLPEKTDREITGGSMALKDSQFDELSKLPTGIATIYQNDWQEAILCKVNKFKNYEDIFTKSDISIPAVTKLKKENDRLLHILLNKSTTVEPKKIKDYILKSNVAAKVKKDLITNLGVRNIDFEWAIADFIKKNYDLSDVFRGTQNENWSDLSELSGIMISNLQAEFLDFNSAEMQAILYYVCRIEHELYPEHSLIEKLRVEYLREKVI